MVAIKESLKCVALAAFCALLLSTTTIIWRAPSLLERELRETRTAAVNEVDSQFTALRADVLGKSGRGGAIGALRDSLSAQVFGIRRDLFGRDGAHGAIGGIRDSASTLITDQSSLAIAAVNRLQTSAESRLDLIGSFLSTVLEDPEKGLIPPVLSVVRIVNQVAVDHLIEKGNHASWPADVSGLLRALELSMGSVEKAAKAASDAAPKFVSDAAAVTGDIHREADQLTKPPTFWSALRSWTLTLARIAALF